MNIGLMARWYLLNNDKFSGTTNKVDLKARDTFLPYPDSMPWVQLKVIHRNEERNPGYATAISYGCIVEEAT